MLKLRDFELHPGLKNFVVRGTIVFLIDGSYMVQKGTNLTGNHAVMISPEGKDPYQVIDVNKPFPTDNYIHNSAVPINNCKIRNLRTGRIYYASPINFLSIETGSRKCVFNGKEVSVLSIFGDYKFLNKKLCI